MPWYVNRIVPHAKAAALRSADLSRQVGAVITGDDGDILSTGCNDVPKAGGGLYWSGEDDTRDFQLGYDPNSKIKRDIVLEILGRMKEAGWLSDEKKTSTIDSLLNDALSEGKKPIFEGARVANVIEFGRIIHAEMAAILHAARRGTPVGGTTLHCTTFPCHMCARHIVAAGIKKVVFIEPYPKSMAHDLYSDSISINSISDRLVNFVPFEGVAPRRFIELFEKFKRKDEEGKAFVWNERKARPNLERIISSYVIVEGSVILRLRSIILALGLNTLAEHLGEGEVNAARSEGA